MYPLRRVPLFQKGVHTGEQIFLAVGGLDGVDVLRTGVVHAGHNTVHLAGVGIPHLAADEVGHIPPPGGQSGIAAVKIEHLPPQRTGGIHVADALQLEQRHLPLRADGHDLVAPAALGRSIQPADLFQERHAVAPELQFHFTAHTVGGHDLACFQILLHRYLLFPLSVSLAPDSSPNREALGTKRTLHLAAKASPIRRGGIAQQ